MSPPPFRLFGADHLLALAATAAFSVVACALTRRDPAGPIARALARGLAGLLVAGVGGLVALELARGTLSPLHFLPLHLCDLLIPVAVLALLTRAPLLFELVYFWAGTGGVLAAITPIVPYGFPDRAFLVFFGFHGAVIAAAALLAFGHRMRPRPGAALRVWWLTCVYAVFVAGANALLGTNYMFLSRKPPGPTLLDWLGPWPVYIVAAALLGLALFRLLELPFRHAR